MRKMKGKSVSSRYFILSMMLVLCMLISMINAVPFFSEASDNEEPMLSKKVMASITLDGKNPKADQFEFELVDNKGDVVATTKNDAAGNVIFSDFELKEEAATYKVRLVEKATDEIKYDNTEKTVNVIVKENRTAADPYEGVVDFKATSDAAGNITVHYTVDGKPGTTKAYCINTDIGLVENDPLTSIKDPSDETLSWYILQEYFNWESQYGKKVHIVGYEYKYMDLTNAKFIGYLYKTKNASVTQEIKSTFNNNSISDVLRRTLYYVGSGLNEGEQSQFAKDVANQNFKADTIGYFDGKLRKAPSKYGQMGIPYSIPEIQKFSEEQKKTIIDRNISDRKLFRDILVNDYIKKNDNKTKQNIVWASVGGNLGMKRSHLRQSEGTAYDLYPDTGPQDFVSPLKARINTFNVPSNYHIMIFANPSNTSQPLAFGYFDYGKRTKLVKETWVNVPRFAVTTLRTINVKKNWIGDEAGSVKVTLMKGSVEMETKTITAADSWKTSFGPYERYENGEEINYSIKEENVAGYTSKITGDMNSGFVINNTENTQIRVTKKWVGEIGNQITLVLKNKATDEVAATKVIKKSELANGDSKTWEITFDVPKYDASKHKIEYVLEEVKVNGYRTKSEGNQNSGFTLTNTESKKISIIKKWIGKPGTKINITLKNRSTGEDIGTLEITKDTPGVTPKLDKDHNTTTWTIPIDVDKYDISENEIDYEVEEADVPGYTKHVEKNGDQFTIVNTEEVTFSAKKNWLNRERKPGNVGDSITVYLKKEGSQTPVDTKILTKAENEGKVSWSFEFKPVPKYDDTGKEIKYFVEEAAVQGYDTEDIKKDSNGIFIINNIEKHKEDKTSIKITKEWYDRKGNAGKVGKSITVQVKNKNTKEVLAEKTLTKEDIANIGKLSWEYTFDGLDVYDDKNIPIDYTVDEVAPEGYEKVISGDAISGFTIKNTEKPIPKQKIYIIKKWVGKVGTEIKIAVKNKLTGAPVDTITINRQSKGFNEYKDETQPNTTIWEVPVEVDKLDEERQPITYEVKEVVLPGFNSNTNRNSNTQFTITNTELVNVAVNKKWLGKVGENVTISLMNGDLPYTSRIVTASAAKPGDATTWSVEFEAPKYDASGREITYTVTETAISGYKAKLSGNIRDGFTITNTETGKNNFKVIKKWIGAEGEQITIRIKDANTGEELLVRTVKKTEPKLNRVTFENNPNIVIWEIPVEVDKIDKEGRKIAYSVDEDDIANYKKTMSSAECGDVTITNTEVVSHKIIKKWNGQVGSEVKVELKLGEDILETKTLTSADLKAGTKNIWEASFKAVPKYDTWGNKLNYTVEELGGDSYVKEIKNNQDGSFTITNTEKVKIRVDKKWLGKRASSVTLKLMNGAETVDTKTVTEGNAKAGDPTTWSVEFEAPKYDASGSEIAYTVTEAAIAGYEASLSGNQDSGFTITNKDTEKTNIRVDKKWLGKRASSVTLKLMNGAETVDTKTVNEGNAKAGDATTWSVEFEAPKYDASGSEIAYTVTEAAISGYEASLSGNQASGFTITNKDTEKTNIRVDKKWLGKRASSVTLKLMNGAETVDTKTVTEGNAKAGDPTTWSVEFEAPMYDANGSKIAYTVTEAAISGYEASLSGNQESGFIITNEDTEKVRIRVDKKWLGRVAESITIYLMNENIPYASQTVTASAAKPGDPTTWSVELEVPKYDASGSDITYTVTEAAIAGYKASLSGDQTSGFTITNEDTERIKIKVDKKWVGKIGDEITVSLMSGSSIVEAKTVTASAVSKTLPNTWEIEFKAPKYDAGGSEIAYTVTEAAIDGYEASLEGTKESGFIITNTQKPEPKGDKIKIKVNKKWIGKPGDRISVSLWDVMNNREVETKEVTASAIKDGDPNNWYVEFEAPEKDTSGNEINYTVTESAIAGYEANLEGTKESGFTITNTQKPGPNGDKIKIKVNKKWVGKPGDRISVSLWDVMNNRAVETKEVTASAIKDGDPNNWYVEFDAPEYDSSGNKIIYTVKEVELADYDGVVSSDGPYGFTITNTQKPEPKGDKIKIKVNKKWVGKPGDRISVSLWNVMNNRVVETKEVTASAIKDGNPNNWYVEFEAPEYDSGGNRIIYTVKEVELADYDGVVSSDGPYGFTITNTQKPEPKGDKIKVNKKWVGKPGDRILVSLWNVMDNRVVETKEVTASAIKDGDPNNWYVEFEAPKNDTSGNEINYTVTESSISGFRAKVEGTKESGFTITNVEQENLKVIKTWIGAEGDKITIRIKDADNGNEIYVRTVYKTDTDIKRITDTNRPNITIWEIPVAVDKVDITGKNITYSVDEEALPNYGKTITVNTGDKTVTITNTEEVNIKVIKKWIGKVGDKITVNLMSGSAIMDTKVVTESAVVNGDKSTWEVVFKAVPKYDATGKAIEYTVDEKDMTNYNKTITDNKDNSFTIANKEMPNNKNEKVVIKVTKKWIGKTEKEITILLKNGDTVVERRLVTESAIKDGDKNTWEVSFEAPKHDADGNEIKYTVDEQPVSGYVKTLSGNRKDGFTITNAEGITVKVTKKWEGKVGDTITVVLKNGNTVIERRIVTKAAVVSGEIATWQIAFEAAKLDTSGNEIKYNVEEEAVTGYTTSITGDYKAGFIITNKEKPQEPSTPPTPPTPPTPIIPPIPPTPIIPPYIPPYIPPTPSIPEIPVTPDPIPKDVPKFPSDKTPDPNKPGSPDDFVTVDKDGTPKGRYVKSKKPNGKNTYIEVNLDGTPKGVLPRTGSADNTVYYVGGCTLLLFAGLIMLKKRKRSNN